MYICPSCKKPLTPIENLPTELYKSLIITCIYCTGTFLLVINPITKKPVYLWFSELREEPK